jgi:hypothetical protein
MTMTVSLRNFMLTAHVTTSVGWIGALAVFLAHSLVGLLSQDDQTVRAVSLAMGLTAWFVILPLSLASLVTGIVQAIGTAWGLMRHYWIVFKLILTAVATVVLLLKLGPISYLAETASDPAFSGAELFGLRISTALHAAGGLSVLLLAAGLAVYKPQGMTPYGVRKRLEEKSVEEEPWPGPAARTPRWVKVIIAVIAILALMIGFMMLGGDHGPGAHVP